MDPVGGEVIEHSLDHAPAGHREQRLRGVEGERSEAGALAARQDDRPHDLEVVLVEE
jgi:hypothetical protein